MKAYIYKQGPEGCTCELCTSARLASICSLGLSDQPGSEDFSPVRQLVHEALRGVDASEAVRFDPVISDDFKRAPVTQSDYERGFAAGKNCGYDSGYSDGYIDGHKDGYIDGHRDGYAAGVEDASQ